MASRIFVTSSMLAKAPRNLFFTGKGGVGKTSLSTATALALADAGKRVLLVSTDSASNLDEMLGCTLSNHPTAVPLVPRLSVLSIDPNRAVDAYRARVLAQMPHASAQERAGVEEEMSGSCTVEVAVFDEFSSLLAGDDDASEAAPATTSGTKAACCPQPAASVSVRAPASAKNTCCPLPAALAGPNACCPPSAGAKASDCPPAKASTGAKTPCCPPAAASVKTACCPPLAASAGAKAPCCPPPAGTKTACCAPPSASTNANPCSAPCPPSAASHPASAHAHFDHIVFDTAPSGHTLKLLSLPRAWASFLTGNDRGAACLGPHCGMSMQRTRFERAVSALTDPAQTLLVLVARPEKTALAEAAHTSVELMGIGLRRQHLIINGVFRAADRGDAIAAAFEDTGRACIEAMPSELKALPRDEVPLRSFDTNSLPALRALLTSGDVKIDLPPVSSVLTSAGATPAPHLQALIGDLAASSHGLVMVMGKGGVGKTTVAAALAAGLVARGLRVHLSTTDPSSHLLATLDGGQLPGLVVSRIDPAEEKRRYIDSVMATRGATLDDAGRALLAEDLRSPCTEEVAVFEAFSRAVESSAADFVVMDTAPTGHSLLLIDAAGAYQRQSARELGSSSELAEAPARIVSPLARLRDATQTRVVIVTTPEPTPVSQAAALQADLLRAGISAYGWVLNRSLAAADTKDPLLLARLRSERVQHERITANLSQRLYVVPFSPVPPVGLDALGRLVAPTTAPVRHSE